MTSGADDADEIHAVVEQIMPQVVRILLGEDGPDDFAELPMSKVSTRVTVEAPKPISPSIAEVRQALDNMREGLHQDGYDLKVNGVHDGVATLTILALEDACEDCLVPPDTMAAIIHGSIPDHLGVRSVTITYPDASHGSHQSISP